MSRILFAACLLALACGKDQMPAPKSELSELAKQVVLTYDSLKVQPGAAAFMKELDANADLSKALAVGLDANSKAQLNALVEKHAADESFRESVIAAGGDPASCGAPAQNAASAPGSLDPGCKNETPNLLMGGSGSGQQPKNLLLP